MEKSKLLSTQVQKMCEEIPLISSGEIENYFGKGFIKKLIEAFGKDADVSGYIFRANGNKGKIKNLNLKDFSDE
jgi:hypothetical protein